MHKMALIFVGFEHICFFSVNRSKSNAQYFQSSIFIHLVLNCFRNWAQIIFSDTVYCLSRAHGRYFSFNTHSASIGIRQYVLKYTSIYFKKRYTLLLTKNAYLYLYLHDSLQVQVHNAPQILILKWILDGNMLYVLSALIYDPDDSIIVQLHAPIRHLVVNHRSP